MESRHPGFKSYYIHVAFDRDGFKFDPHYLEVPTDIVATITWYTDDPAMTFTRFAWCSENEHCSHHPILRGTYMVGAAQTRVAAGNVYWKYRVWAEVTDAHGKKHEHASPPCDMTTDGLPAIHPK